MVKDVLFFLDSLPWVFGTISIMLSFILLALVGILIIKKNTQSHHLKIHHDVSGFVFTNLGVLYSVLLGFTVVNVQQRFDEINQTAKIEASCLAELYRDAEIFTEKDKVALKSSLKAYGESIIEHEWKHISKGPNPMTTQMLNAVWKAYYEVDLETKKQKILYAQSINKLNNLMSVRLSRLLGGEDSLSDEMWSFLIFGGIIIVAFISIFSFESLWLHILLATILASSTAFLLFLIYSLDTAFSGNVKIPPEALKATLQSFT